MEHAKFEEFTYTWFPDGTGQFVVAEIANSIAKLKKETPEGEQPIGKGMKCRLGPFVDDDLWTPVGGPEISRQDLKRGSFNMSTIDLTIGVSEPDGSAAPLGSSTPEKAEAQLNVA